MLKDKIKKKNFNYTKVFRTKITIKKIRIKIKTKNKFYFWLNGEIENKNQFNKRTQEKIKQSKEWGSK